MNKQAIGKALIAALILLSALSAIAQQQTKPTNPIHLELTTEVATTTDDGTPTSLRITLKNTGDVAVNLPVLQSSCSPDGGISIQIDWTSNDPEDRTGYGSGHSCGMSDWPSALSRAREDWVHLRPGEFLTTSESLRSRLQHYKRGAIQYWAEFIPPVVKPEELDVLQQLGYVITREKLKSEPATFEWRPPAN